MRPFLQNPPSASSREDDLRQVESQQVENPTETAQVDRIEDAESKMIPVETDDVIDSPVGSFDRVPESLRAALLRRGFSALTSVQLAALDAGTSSADIMISSQTGSGKTVALGFVMAQKLIASVADWNPRSGYRGPGAVVIVPTRELAAQVHEELEWLFADVVGVQVDSVTGGTNIGRERSRLNRSPRILVGTPGRLLDHIKNGAVDCSEVSQIVLDEADQMLDMGFREELEGILEKMPKERQTHLISATFPPAVRKLAERYQSLPVHVEGTALGEAHADIDHTGHLVHGGDRYAALVNLLLLADGQRTLVFVQTRIEAAQIADRLSNEGFAVLPLSGDLQQAQRTRTLSAFKTGVVTTLIATDVASRGLDVPDVPTVIHFDLPKDPSIYTHRSGRTGRAGNRGRSVILVPVRAERRVRRLVDTLKIEFGWHDVPTAAKVAKLLGKRSRRRIQAHLDGELTLTDSQLDYARKLFEERDAARVVAGLMQLVEQKQSVRPRDIQVPSVRAGTDDRRRTERSRGHDRSGHRVHAGSNRRGGGDFARFTVTWGDRRGANPKRLLALVCRRGDISSRMVGMIHVGPLSSTVEVARDAATGFESKARRRDTRDPHVRIHPEGRWPARDRAPRQRPPSDASTGPRQAPKSGQRRS